MQVNGEGIYATKAIAPYQDGPVYYTAKRDTVYAFYVAEEGESLPEQIAIPSFVPVSSKAVTLLGSKKVLKWSKSADGGVVVTIPASLRKTPPCQHIWCLKIKVKD